MPPTPMRRLGPSTTLKAFPYRLVTLTCTDKSSAPLCKSSWGIHTSPYFLIFLLSLIFSHFYSALLYHVENNFGSFSLGKSGQK